MSKEYCEKAPMHPVHAFYHEAEYGFPISGESVLFERLCLEIMQAGLSWETVLKKRKALNAAFDGFRVSMVARYGDRDVERLLADETIIRNRLKVRAIITNAQSLLGLRKTHGGFAKWLAAHHPLGKAEWVKLFRETFTFTGGEIVGEFLMSIGYLPGAHEEGCPVYDRVLAERPPWATGKSSF